MWSAINSIFGSGGDGNSNAIPSGGAAGGGGIAAGGEDAESAKNLSAEERMKRYRERYGGGAPAPGAAAVAAPAPAAAAPAPAPAPAARAAPAPATPAAPAAAAPVAKTPAPAAAAAAAAAAAPAPAAKTPVSPAPAPAPAAAKTPAPAPAAVPTTTTPAAPRTFDNPAPLLALVTGLPPVIALEGGGRGVPLTLDNVMDAFTEVLTMGTVAAGSECPATWAGSELRRYTGMTWLVAGYNKAGGRGEVGGRAAAAAAAAGVVDLRPAVAAAVQGHAVQFLAALAGNDEEELYPVAPRRLAVDETTAIAVPALIAGAGSRAAAVWALVTAATADACAASGAVWGERATLRVSNHLLAAVMEAMAADAGDDGMAAAVAPLAVYGLERCRETAGFGHGERPGLVAWITTMAGCRPLARALVAHPAFTGPLRRGGVARPPARNAGAAMELETLLGALLSPSALPVCNTGEGALTALRAPAGLSPPSPVLDMGFNRVLHTTRPAVAAAWATVRGTTRAAVAGVQSIVGALLRVDTTPDKPCRDAVLAWVGDVLAANGGRAKEHVDVTTVANDGFFLNLGVLLVALCMPVWEAAGTAKCVAGGGGDAVPAGDKLAVIEPSFLLLPCASMRGTAGGSVDYLVAAAAGGAGAGSGAAAAAARGGSGSGSRTAAAAAADSDADGDDDGDDGGLAAALAASAAEAAAAAATAAPAAARGGSGGATASLFDDAAAPATATAAAGTSVPAGVPVAGKAEGEYKFVTRVFFYTLRALELGLVRVAAGVRQEERIIEYLQRRRSGGGSDGERAEEHLEVVLSNKTAMDAARQDPEVLLGAATFSAMACEFVARVASGAATAEGSSGGVPVALPFPDAAYPLARGIPEAFATTPLHVLSYIGGLWSVTGRNNDVMATLAASRSSLATILHFFVALLASPPAYVRSPHLRAEGGDMLYNLFLPARAKPHNDSDAGAAAATSPSDIAAVLLEAPAPFAARWLAPALMGLYGDLEATGYFEKVGHRMKVAALLTYLWALPPHRSAFHAVVAAGGDASRFVGFANGLIGHTTAMLTDALKGLPLIRETLAAQADGATWAALPAEARTERERELSDTTSQVKNALMLANQTTPLLAVLTEDADMVAQLMREELVDRLAGMLMNALTTLAGPKGVELRVSDPESYNFRPKALLLDTCTALLRLAAHARFLRAVAESGFFVPATMDRVSAVLARYALLPADAANPISLPAFARFVADTTGVLAQVEEDTELFDDAPDEFKDPIMLDVMADPVKAPSGYIFDRPCILQHLMNTPSDPFTRGPLTPDDLVPLPELKARIEAWKAEKRAAARAAKP